MRISFLSILKFICAVFLGYYCWFRVLYPSTEGLLVPFGVLMVGFSLLYIMICHVDLREMIDFPIASWVLFSIVEFIAAFFVARSISYAQSYVFTFFELALMCSCFVLVAREEGNTKFLFQVMYIVCVIYVITMLVKNNQISGRLALVNANGDANVCLIGIVCGITLFDTKKKLPSFFILISIIIMFYANLMTGSRKSFYCMMFVFAFWLIEIFLIDWKKFTSNGKLLFVFFSLLMVFLALQYIVPLILNSTTGLRLLGGQTGGDELRVQFYEEAIQLFKEHPLFGVGYNNFRLYNSSGYYAHSTYAEIIADCGIVGSILYFLPHIWIVVNLLKIMKTQLQVQDIEALRKAFIIFVYMISSLVLAVGMVQTSNERVLMMYAIMFAYVDINIKDGGEIEWENSEQLFD